MMGEARIVTPRSSPVKHANLTLKHWKYVFKSIIKEYGIKRGCAEDTPRFRKVYCSDEISISWKSRADGLTTTLDRNAILATNSHIDQNFSSSSKSGSFNRSTAALMRFLS